MPCLEYQNIPKEILPVALARLVLVPFPRDRRGVEQSRPAECLRAQQIAGPFFQRASQPSINRHGEAHLWALQQIARHIFASDLAQNPFACSAPYLEPERQPP